MRQVIARVADDVHERLKARATQEGRSLNALLAELLAAGADAPVDRSTIRERARANGILRTVPRPTRVPSWEEVDALTRGVGGDIVAAFEEERTSR